MNGARLPWFVKRDIDGFFGLMIDNLVQLVYIATLAPLVAGLPASLIYGRVLPGAALSVLVGNLFYAWQARRVAAREGRTDVTALPYGINTPSVFAFIFFIMGPVYHSNLDKLGADAAAQLAWRIGIGACLINGLIELTGALYAERIRKATPRAALISALAGIAIGFISMDFILQVFERPLLALAPMGIILIQYFSGVRLPWGAPAGLAALVVGAAVGWGLKGFAALPLFAHLAPSIQTQISAEIANMPASWAAFRDALRPTAHMPVPVLGDIAAMLRSPEERGLLLQYLNVIIPMGVFTLIGSLQNIESAEAAGDKFPTAPALAANGVGTLVAGLLGSCFPTTIYIGHVGWKRLGARWGYSILNGAFITFICLTGLVQSVRAIVPMESVIGILLWIAIIITAQAFQSTPRAHAPAVVLGLIPGIAAWGLLMFKNGMISAGAFLDPSVASPEGLMARMGVGAFPPYARLGGLIALDRGFIMTSMGLAAMGVMIIERRFKAAAVWAWILAGLSALGVIHAWNPLRLDEFYSLGPENGWRFALGYAGLGAILFGLRRAAASAEGSAHGEFDAETDLDGLAPIGPNVKTEIGAGHGSDPKS